MSHTILILEDEALVAFDLQDELTTAGFTVMGPFAGAKEALSALGNGASPAAALLDYALGGDTTSVAVAEELERKNIPFAFMTGYAATGLLDGAPHSDRPRLAKPCDTRDVVATLEALVGSERRRS